MANFNYQNFFDEVLVLDLAVPDHQHPPTREHVVEANRAARTLGIKIRTLTLDQDHASINRYVFHFPRYRRNDAQASRIGESLAYAVDLTCGPFRDPRHSATVFPIPSVLLSSNTVLTKRRLIELEESREPRFRTLDFPALALSATVGFVAQHVAAAWRATPPIYSNDRLHNAARFYRDSQEHFFVYPGQYEEVVYGDAQEPQSGWEKSTLEAALLAAFKTVEVLLGALPSGDARLRRKLQSLGFDPYEPFGFPEQMPLFRFLRVMEDSRDKRSAHGSTPFGPVTVKEMFLFQNCARWLLVRSIESAIGRSLE